MINPLIKSDVQYVQQGFKQKGILQNHEQHCGVTLKPISVHTSNHNGTDFNNKDTLFIVPEKGKICFYKPVTLPDKYA